LSSKSEVLAKLTSGDFKEKEEKILRFPEFSDDAVEKFIKFLYGFEFSKDDVNMDVAKELMRIGEMYNVASLTDAAGVVIKDLLTKENVFEVWKFCKEINVANIMDRCGEFVVQNFDSKTLHENEKILEGWMFCWMFNFAKNDQQKNVMRFSAPRTYVSFNKESSARSSINFYANVPIKVTGVGVSILPGSSVTVEMKIGEFVQKTDVVNNTNVDCVPVMFEEGSRIKERPYNCCHVEVSITGVGVGISCTLDPKLKLSEGGVYVYQKTVQASCGKCLKEVTFKRVALGGACNIQEIYFEV